jgi:hypothetical protein
MSKKIIADDSFKKKNPGIKLQIPVDPAENHVL